MTFRDTFRKWMIVFVLCPLALLLAGANIQFYRSLRVQHDALLSDTASRAAAAFDQALGTYRIRLRSLGLLPTTTSLLSARERLRRDRSQRGRWQEAEKLNEAWPTLAETELRVREILNNEVAEMFRQITYMDAVLHRLLLTDAEGLLLAASHKPLYYDQSNLLWWNTLRKSSVGSVVAEELQADGMLALSLLIPRDPETATKVHGAIQAVLDVRPSVATLKLPPRASSFLVALIGADALPVAGDESAFEGVKTMLPDLAVSSRTGWRQGFRYRVLEVNTDIDWQTPLRVAVLRPESRFPLPVYVPLLVAIVISLVVLGLLWRSASRWIDRRVLTPAEQNYEAGQWVLRNALDKPPADKGQGHMTAALDTWLQEQRTEWQRERGRRAERMQRDLELAKDFQMAMLERPYPRVPEIHVEGRLRLDFHHRYEPASALGGDFFDIVTLGPDCAGILVADVMGHGTRSALITSILRTLLGDLVQQGRNAPHFLNEINKQFCGLLKSVPNPIFASAYYFVADTTARVATYSSAGHPPPFHMRRSLGRITRLKLPPPHGTALGVIPDESYPGGHCRLMPEDVFIFYTDGVYEAHNAKGEEFGVERMGKVLRKLMYKPSCREIVDGLLASVKDFVGEEPVADDICIVAVEVTTRAADNREAG